MNWTQRDMPDLDGRTALVTGATDGLGLQTALALASKGATVMLAGRNPAKGEAALKRIRSAWPDARIGFEPVELEDLSTVRHLAGRAGRARLDILVNNAGVMGLPQRRTTADGFEVQLGVNYLSHFVLSGLLLPALRRSAAPRVVNLSSMAHRAGRIDFDDLQAEKRYSPFKAYGQSKLAMLMFALELQRRSDAHGWGLVSTAAHPGFARTNLMSGMSEEGGRPKLSQRLGEAVAPLLSHGAVEGAGPQLLAATRLDVSPGSYWGPTGFGELKGSPGPAKMSRAATDRTMAARLWDVSQSLTNNPFGEGA